MPDSQDIVKGLLQVDPQFVLLCKALVGENLDPRAAWDYLYGPVEKMMPDASSAHVPAPMPAGRGVLVPKMPPNGAPGPTMIKPPAPPIAAKPPTAMGAMPLKKAYESFDESDTIPVVWAGEFAKADTEERKAFGWASVVEVNGQPIIDLQGDITTPHEIEKAAYDYVQDSRIGGDQHARDEWGEPLQAGQLIESMVYTDEKYEALAKAAGMDPSVFDDAPRGWWVGFQYEDGPTWDDIRSGRKTGFSIHGAGKRAPVGAF